MDKPWYDEGLRFSCQTDCTQCCSALKGGYVLLENADIARMAETLGISQAVFVDEFVTTQGGRLVVKMAMGRCSFSTSAGCAVYSARPMQCRTFPFWPEYTEDAEAWEKAKARCPGAGEGELHDAAYINAQVQAVSLARIRAPLAGVGV